MGRSRQPRMFISVDLPEPDVPMMATNSPVLDRPGSRSAARVPGPRPCRRPSRFPSVESLGVHSVLRIIYRCLTSAPPPPPPANGRPRRRSRWAAWRLARRRRHCIMSPSFKSPETISVRTPSVTPVCTVTGVRAPSFDLPHRRSATALPGQRRRRSGRKRSALRHREHVVALRHSHRHIGSHARLQFQVRIGHVDHRRVGDHVLHRCRRQPDLRDRAAGTHPSDTHPP